jgi:hypothetical protein
MKKIASFLIIIIPLFFISCDRQALVEDLDDSTSSTPYFISVVNSNPAPNETNIALNSTISILFNDNINAATLNSSTFYVTNGATISGTYFYDQPNKVAVFTPATQLSANTTYQVTLTTGITNIAGESLQSSQTWSFSTTIAAEPEINVYENTYPLFSGNILDVGNEVIATSKPIFFSISNSGLTNLIISNITISGTDISEFSLNMPTLLPISTSSPLEFSVDFIPASNGVKNIQVIIDSNDSSEPQFIINLKATAVTAAAPYILVYKGTLPILKDDVCNIGTTLIGTTSPESTISILNRGSTNLNISAINLSGTEASLFNLNLGPLTTPIAINSNSSFNVSFTPLENGSRKTTVLIDNDDPGMPIFNFSVSGRGTK